MNIHGSNRIDESIQDHLETQNDLKTLYNLEVALDVSTITLKMDHQGFIINANKLFCDISGYLPSEIIGKKNDFFRSKLHSPLSFNEVQSVIREGRVWKGEICHKKKNGTLFWIDATIVPYLNNNNEVYEYIIIGVDITKHKQVALELKQNNEFYQIIASHTTELIALIDKHGCINYASPSLEAYFNYSSNKVDHYNLFQQIHPDEKDNVIATIHSLKEKRVKTSFRVKNHKNDYIDVEATVNIVQSENLLNQQLYSIVMKDIRGRKEFERRNHHFSYFDSLTDLSNRRFFMNNLREEIINKKYSSSKIAILFIDIDNFKAINDQWGHDTGDLVLIEVAKKLKSTIRPNDIAARLGGDEFIVMLKDIRSPDEIEKYVQFILTSLQTPICVSDNQHFLTCSIGIAVYPDAGKVAEQLLKNANEALFNAKSKGKNCYLIFDKNLESRSLEHRLLESAMRIAVKKQQFYLEYQPKLNIINNKLIGMEALVRWDHPDLGKISPRKFIPLAEETGLIIPLGEWILLESCRQNKEWQNKGFSPLVISVNVSVRQLEDPYFVAKLEKILTDTGLDSRWLELELTESVFADVKNASSILHEIRNLGIQISIDDFGTGYSSLSYIKHLPINTLKVDASFIKDIHQNEESNAIVKAVLTLAQTIGLNVIAEGVEVKEHVDKLTNDGCTFGQGYYFSRPLKNNVFEKYMIKAL